MRKQTFLFTTGLLFFISSCRPVASFPLSHRSDENRGTLYLTNGQAIDGYLEIDLEKSAENAVRVYTPETKKTVRYPLSQIKGYTVHNEFYLLKEVNKPIEIGKGHSLLGQLVAGKTYSFMKRLTPERSRIHIYECVEKQAAGNNAAVISKTEYYIALPGEPEHRVYPLDDSRLVPNFDAKMSRMVSDCPALAQKIAGKEPGYTYAQLNIVKEKRLAVLLNIIEEYNHCH